jgi:putative alpha-1,2-mannosidase
LKRHVYTNLMDAVLHPDTFTDVDGQFCGFDLKTHQAKLEPSDATFSPIGIIDGKTVPVRGNRYHHFSSWDTKYAQQPLIALLWPEVGADIAQSFLDQARTGLGGFARWSIGQREFGTMEGDPSAIMIASTWSLGARTFEVEAALDTMIRVATTPGIECQPGFLARPGLGRYLTQGLARNDAKADRLGKPFVQWGNASPDSGGTSGTGGRPYSQTLDYAIADFGISRMALAHGKADIADRLLRQAQHWQAVIDPKTRMFIGQETNGGYAESGGRAAQFMVPHNWPKLAELMGGVDQALAHWNAHPPHLHNEDNHYAPWALNWLGRPWECQKYQRVAFLTQFCQPSGLARGERWTWSWPEAYDWSKLQQKIPGSNDLGAMTAMGFWMAVGIFPVLPGEAGFSVGSPIIPRIVLKRGTLGSLTVIAKDADPLNAYVQSLTVNGKAWNSSWIPGELLPFGKDHVLEFQMGKEPNQHWGNDPQPPHFDAVPWYKNPTP